MTNNAAREAFEKWWTDRKGQGYVSFKRDKHGEYVAEFVRDAWDAWQIRAQASGVPDGWKLVPKIPTHEMMEAAIAADHEYQKVNGLPTYCQVGCYDHYVSMYEAAPTPPKSASVPVERLEAFVTQHGGNATHACDENEVLASLAELIAEYKRVEDQSCT